MTSLEAAEEGAKTFVSALEDRDEDELRNVILAYGHPPTDQDIATTLEKFGGPGTTLVPGSVISEFSGTGIFTVSHHGHKYRFKEQLSKEARKFLVDVEETY